MFLSSGAFHLLAVPPAGPAAAELAAVAVDGDRPVLLRLPAIADTADRRARRAFLARMRALDGLRHRAWPAPLAFGFLPHEAGSAAGRPFLIEAAPVTLAAPCDWPSLARVLFVLLDGLAHGHARGALHGALDEDALSRDGGPCLCRAAVDLPAPPIRDDAPTRPILGPTVRAPEQGESDAAAVGPWTDLYALGALAWQLITGAPLFDATTPWAVQRAHRTTAPPALAPRFAVPEGLEPWLGAVNDLLDRLT